MPIISRVGWRSWSVRAVYVGVYVALLLGAVTMVYPFLLMLAGSVKSEADAFLITPYPEFWRSDAVLFQKYAESKHNASLDECRMAWNQPLPTWNKAVAPPALPRDVLEDFRAWREAPGTRDLAMLGHTRGARLLPKNARLYRRRLIREFDGDIAAYRRMSGTLVAGWSSVDPPPGRMGRYWNFAVSSDVRDRFASVKAESPLHDLYFPNPEGQFVQGWLTRKYAKDIAALNAAYGTRHAGFEEVRLPRLPPANGAARSDWSDFVRKVAWLESVRISPDARDSWRAFLERRHRRVAAYNAVHGTAHASFEGIPFVERIDAAPELRVEWEAFLRDPSACRDEWLEVFGPYERFLAFRASLGRSAGEIAATPPLGVVAAGVDHADCLEHRRSLRIEFTTRNYKHVAEYIALHGNGILNTVLYCALAILTALTVNPLAAYALSRFRLPGTYKILLFCMATMAFPGEVSMIPSFILMKRFPLWPLVAAVATLAAVFLLLERFAPRWREPRRALLSLGAALVVGAVLVPAALGPERGTVSLLNTFAALILPGAANGYFIFLLKGFFDSMPKELYEAAELDGAGEWTKFWALTMSLSRPILAVIALGAFTSAYSAFMMALIIIPDERMWTLMVWIFQLQSQSHGAVVYASLVVAALPTFLIFALCQNTIIKGIVVPTEK